jgi:26S proteasome regulatory subunit, ATPase 3, interacting protein
MSNNKANKKLVLDYLVKVNRPVNATDLTNSDVFNGKIGKSAITTCLTDLASSNDIIEKVYGKAKVYMARQQVTTTTANLKGELRDLDEKIILTKSELSRVKSSNYRFQSELKGLGDTTPINDLKNERDELLKEIETLKQKLNELKTTSSGPPITKEDQIKVNLKTKRF